MYRQSHLPEVVPVPPFFEVLALQDPLQSAGLGSDPGIERHGGLRNHLRLQVR